MMSADLSTIDRIFLSHTLFDECVSCLTTDCISALFIGDLYCIPGQSWIMNNLCSWITRQEGLGQQPDNIVPIDESASLVKEKATIEVTVPSNSNIGFIFDNGFNSRLAIFFEQWIWNPMRKVAVRLVMYFKKIEWQMTFY